MSKLFSRLVTKPAARPERRPSRRPAPFRPRLEEFEDRALPTPVITVEALTPEVAEGGQARYRLTRTETAGYLMVGLSWSGTATNGPDYSGGVSAGFSPGSATAEVVVPTYPDELAEPTETITLTISPAAGFYTVGTPGSATINLTNVAPPNIFTGGSFLTDAWSNGANWSLGRAPIATDDVILPDNPWQGSTMDGNYTVKSVTLPFGSEKHVLQGTLAITGTLTWDDGVIAGGTLQLLAGSLGVWDQDGYRENAGGVAGVIQVDANAHLLITGDEVADHRLTQSTLINDGYVKFSYTDEMALDHIFGLNAGSSIVNMPNGLLEFTHQAQNGAIISLVGSGNSYFMNEGTILVMNSVLVDYELPFNNTGEVQIYNNCRVSIKGGGEVGGTVNLFTAATFLDVIAADQDSSATLTGLAAIGPGTTNLKTLDQGLIFVVGPDNTLNNVILDGRLDGGGVGGTGSGGTLKIAGELRVMDTVSRLLQGLTLHILQNASMIIDAPDFFVESGSSLRNNGNVWWYSGTIHADNSESQGPTFQNTGTFSILGNFSLVTMNAPYCTFLNTGTIRKLAGAGEASLAVWLTGPGFVEVSAGAGSLETVNYLFGEGLTPHA